MIQWSMLCHWTCFKLVYSCSGLDTALSSAAFAWPVAHRSRYIWTIDAAFSSPNMMDLTGLLSRFPKQSLQGRGHGEVVKVQPYSEVTYTEQNKFACFSHCCTLALLHSRQTASKHPVLMLYPLCIAPRYPHSHTAQ